VVTKEDTRISSWRDLQLGDEHKAGKSSGRGSGGLPRKSSMTSFIAILFIIFLGGTGFFLYMNVTELKSEIETLRMKVIELEGKNQTLKADLAELTKNMEAMKAAKAQAPVPDKRKTPSARKTQAKKEGQKIKRPQSAP